MKQKLLKIAKDLDKEKIDEKEARTLLLNLLDVRGWLSDKIEIHQTAAINHRKNGNDIKAAKRIGLASAYQSTLIHLSE
jgi:hypothetical protein